MPITFKWGFSVQHAHFLMVTYIGQRVRYFRFFSPMFAIHKYYIRRLCSLVSWLVNPIEWIFLYARYDRKSDYHQ